VTEDKSKLNKPQAPTSQPLAKAHHSKKTVVLEFFWGICIDPAYLRGINVYIWWPTLLLFLVKIAKCFLRIDALACIDQEHALTAW